MATQLSVGSLFSGIGGFDLGFERAGMRTAWFCEQDPFCQRVLAKHWPSVPCYDDVREIGAHNVQSVDILCGGFPCQDISVAGKGAGITGARSGLWSEFARLIGELQPRYAVVENVPALRRRGLVQVLQDLHACGYDAEWDGVSASTIGAPHRRDRIWIIAYPREKGRSLADTKRQRISTRGEAADVARAPRASQKSRSRYRDAANDRGATLSDPNNQRQSRNAQRESKQKLTCSRNNSSKPQNVWATEPDVGRVADGVSVRVDRLRSLGNALVPQIAQWLGERILAYEHG